MAVARSADGDEKGSLSVECSKHSCFHGRHMRSFSPCADKATGDDQRCACKGRRRQRFSEYQPAHDRCPDKGGIFEWNQHLRLRPGIRPRSEEHTSELQSLMHISYAVLCLKKKKNI